MNFAKKPLHGHMPVPPINLVGGVPTLMNGRQPLPAPVFCLFYDQALRESVVGPLYAHGIRAFAVRSNIGVGSSRQTDESIEKAVARLSAVAKIAPEARLIADSLLFPSEAWMRRHPHEGFITADSQILVMGREGLVEGADRRRDYVKAPGPGLADAQGRQINGEDAALLYGRRRVSPFSRLFAKAASRSAVRLIQALRKAGLEDRLWGIFLECYNCGEWNLGMYSPDHGRAAVRQFRAFLRDRHGTDKALRAAWDDPSVTLGSALPPREVGGLRIDGSRLLSARSRDYRDAEAHNLAEQFLTIARTVKKMGSPLAVGGFYPGASAPQSDCRRIHVDPAVDFLATPLAYDNSELGGGVTSQSPFCDALKPLGKVWFDELDTRTHASNPSYANVGRAKTPAQSLDLLWRGAGQMLVRGHHGWWLDFGNLPQHGVTLEGVAPHSWHLHPKILAFHQQFADLWAQVEHLDRRPWGEIKVFIPSFAAREHDVAGFPGMQRHTEWTLAGSSIEYDTLENLIEHKSAPGKLNIIQHAQLIDSEFLIRLMERCDAAGAWFVWMNTPGICSPGRIPDECRTDPLTGLPMRRFPLREPMALEGKVTREGARFLGLRHDALIGQNVRKVESGVGQGMEIGKRFPPVLLQERHSFLDTPGTLPLARYADDGSVAVAMRATASGSTHVVYPLPILNTSFLRALAHKAGCHLFTERDDFVCASQGLLLIHAAYTGIHVLHLPKSANLYDLRAQRPVTSQPKALRLRLARGETRLYRMSE